MRTIPSPEPASGATPVEPYGPRLAWTDLPRPVQRLVEAALGASVQRAQNQRGGFSPGAAARVATSAGRRAFVKACGADTNAHSVDLVAQEAEVLAVLPAAAGARALLGHHREPVEGVDWALLITEDIDGPSCPRGWARLWSGTRSCTWTPGRTTCW